MLLLPSEQEAVLPDPLLHAITALPCSPFPHLLPVHYSKKQVSIAGWEQPGGNLSRTFCRPLF